MVAGGYQDMGPEKASAPQNAQEMLDECDSSAFSFHQHLLDTSGLSVFPGLQLLAMNHWNTCAVRGSAEGSEAAPAQELCLGVWQQREGPVTVEQTVVER